MAEKATGQTQQEEKQAQTVDRASSAQPMPVPEDQDASAREFFLKEDGSLVAENAKLREDADRMYTELKKLQAHCENLGIQESALQPKKLRQSCGSISGSASAVTTGHAPTAGRVSSGRNLIVEQNRKLRIEEQEARTALVELAISFAQVLENQERRMVNRTDSSSMEKKSKSHGNLHAHFDNHHHHRGSIDQSPVPGGTDAGTETSQNIFPVAESREDDKEEVFYSSDEEEMQEDQWKEHLRPRGRGVSAEAYGAWNNRRAAFVPPTHKKTEEQHAGLMSAFGNCPLFSHIEIDIVRQVTWAMPLRKLSPGECIVKQGDTGDSLFVLISGGVEVYDDSATPPKFICKFHRGRVFGELAMLYNVPRMLSIYAVAGTGCVVAQLTRAVYQNLIVRHQMKNRERRETCLCKSRYLDTLNAEQIARLADVLDINDFEAGEVIVRQGEPGDELYIVLTGECAATVETGGGADGEIDIQEHRRYREGDIFGERALLNRTTRAATVTALARSEVLCLTRARFERVLGPLALLKKQHYRTDPRKSISDFYQSGDQRGSRGTCIHDPSFDPNTVSPSARTDWFAVYRPTSRDAIAKMLSGVAVGKGLNVKGKSAKQGRVSGYVPFMQIHKNEEKKLLNPADPSGRVRIFFTTEHDRDRMLRTFEPLLDPDNGVSINGDRVIDYIDLFTGVYGLDIPETVLWEVFIEQPDISFRMGWETGRKSEPAFMDMNLACLRYPSDPKIVLYQSDSDDPSNPHGLLIAYQERTVKPVVSDFDTFLIGSRGMEYSDLPLEQVRIGEWALNNTEHILNNPGPGSWTTRWLEVIKSASQEGFAPTIPKYGFGDPTSYRLIKEVTEATRDTGAIRHGAECFNYFFPQELDDEYLVVWDGFMANDDKAWEYLLEDELREFLIARAAEGYVFPLNPVWIVRDGDWWEVYEALAATPQGRSFLQHFFPKNLGVVERLQAIQDAHPEGFLAHGTGVGSISRYSLALDMEAAERVALTLQKTQEQMGPVADVMPQAVRNSMFSAFPSEEIGVLNKRVHAQPGQRKTMIVSFGALGDDDAYHIAEEEDGLAELVH